MGKEGRTVGVTVRVFAGAGLPVTREEEVRLPAGSRLGELLARYPAPDRFRIVILNGTPARGSDPVLRAGDAVALFPALDGG